MSYTKNYADSPCPKVDAINDIREWLGNRWDKVSQTMSTVPNQELFILAASFVGVQGFPVIAWWELYHGEGSWKTNDQPERSTRAINEV